MLRFAEFHAWSVSPQAILHSLLSANQGDALHRMTRKYYGAQNDYTHIFIVWELISQLYRTSVTQGFLA